MALRLAISWASLVPGTMGGSETYARALLDALSAEPDVDVTVLPPAGLPAGGPGRAVALLAGLALGARRGRGLGEFAVVHHPFTVPVLRPPGAQVVTLHDVAHHDVPEHFPAAERRFRALAYDAAARRAAAVVTPSEHAARRIRAVLGVDAEVVAHGIDHDRFRPVDGEAPPPGLPERFVVYPANLWPHKNHERLVQAMERVADDELVLVLTGRPDPERLAALRSPRVRHLGRVDDEDLPRILRAARAVVVPSLYEGFGAPVLEAMACGVPVACSNQGALPEVAGGAAVLFDPLDVDAIAAAVDRVAGDEAERSRLVDAGLAHAGGRTWTASARGHLAVFRRLG